MLFDVRTLLVTAALSALICAGARGLLWRMHPSLAGLGRWTLGCLMACLAFFLIALRGTVPDLFSLTLAQIFVALGLITAWSGFRAFIGLTPLSLRWQSLAVAGPVLLIGLSHLEQSLPLRAILTALTVALFSGLIAHDLMRHNSSRRIARQATGWIYLINAVFFLARAIAVQHEATTIGEMQSSGLAAVSLLWSLALTISTTLGMVLMASDALQENLDRQASLDPLTGALNRRAFAQLAARELARVRRSGQPLSILMMDLDHFKQINDRLGHAAGDRVLMQFVSIAGQVLRREDVFCRWGGEEFVTLLPDTAAEQALHVAERLRQSFAKEAIDLAPEATDIDFTVSQGMAEWHPGEELEDMLRRSDLALYQAKALGRNRVEIAPHPNLAFQA